jgi:hypothetical protein
LGDASVTVRARVAWSTEDAESPAVPIGPAMGVLFENVDVETRDLLVRFLAGELKRFLL